MQFDEPAFLFLFLPGILALYFLTPASRPQIRNFLLLVATLVFIFWAGQQTIFLLLGAVALNFAAGILIAKSKSNLLLAAAVGANLFLLAWCKYATFFDLPLPAIESPPGYSFFTFVAIAYLVDIRRGDAPALRNPLAATQFFLFFSRLLAGPIVRFRDIGDQLLTRPTNSELFANGVRRFLIGLAKKVLIANTVGAVADQIFSLPPGECTALTAWFGILCYTLQIYFDFSGYTDMAIGIGMMFGFRFPENFNYPYISCSIREFWRRWHITLSSWLRDYLYIPLGGSRCPEWRVCFNMLFVFFLCGLWHGAGWTFIVWGTFHGLFLVIERLGLGKILDRFPAGFGHAYTMLVVMIGWVFFRAASMPDAFHFLHAMSGLSSPSPSADSVLAFMDGKTALAVLAGMVGSLPLWQKARTLKPGWNWDLLRDVALGGLLILSLLFVASQTYVPFIYQNF